MPQYPCGAHACQRSAANTSTLRPMALARTYADLAHVRPVRVRVQGHLSHLGGGNGPPGAPTAEMIPKPASPTAPTRANAKAIVVLRSCARTACSMRGLELAHLRRPPEPYAGGAKQREPKPATMYAAETTERVDAVENPSSPGIITAKADEISYLQ